jgi:hypothetical protein
MSARSIYDEVKCGGTIAYGGTTERDGVRPHMAAHAKGGRRRLDDRRVRRRGPLHGVGRQWIACTKVLAG